MKLNTTGANYVLGESKPGFFHAYIDHILAISHNSTCRTALLDDLILSNEVAVPNTVYILQVDCSANDFRKKIGKKLEEFIASPCVVIIPRVSYQSERSVWISIGFDDAMPDEFLNEFSLTKSLEYAFERHELVNRLDTRDRIYEQVFHNNAMPSMIYNLETLSIIEVNEAAILQYGYSREEFLSISPLVLHPEENRARAEVIMRNLTPNLEYRNTHEHLRKDGTSFQAQIQSNSISYKGKSARSISVVDITQNLEYQKALLNSEQRFKTLVQESGDLILILNSKGVIQYSSTNHWTILGFKENDLLLRNVLELVHEEDRGEMQEFINSLSHSKRLYSNPFRTTNGHGKIVWLEAIGTNAIYEPGINGLVLNTREITNRIESENKLRGISERFAAIAQATSDAIYEYDFTEQYIQLTGIGYHVLLGFGYDNDRMTLDQYKALVHPKDLERVMDFFKKSFDSRKKHFEIEYRLLKPNGTISFVHDRYDLIRDESGIPLKRIGAMQDITSRKFHETILEIEKEIYELNANPKITFDFVLKQLVSQIEKLMPNAFCSIITIDDDHVINKCIGKSISKEFTQQLLGLYLSPTTGAWGAAVNTSRNYIVTDVDQSPIWKDNKELLAKFDFKACWAVPVRKGSGKSIACFATYYKTKKAPSQEEIHMVERISNLLGVILENRQAFEENERVQERYDIVAKATSDTIWDWNIQEDKFEWNKGIRGVFGYKRHEVGDSSRWWFDRIHPEDSIKMSVKLYSFLEQKTEKWQHQYRFACADGSYKYVYDRAFLVKDANGKAIRMISAMQDVTRQKQEEQRLKLLETVITHMKDSVIITENRKDSNTVPKIVFVNPAFTSITGYKATEVIGKSPTVIWDKSTKRQDLSLMLQAFKNKEEFKHEMRSFRKNGEEYWVQFSMMPIANKDGEQSHWISIQRDITEEKSQEKEKEQLIRELTQNNKDLKQFSYITSHNLRAPLSNLTGLLELTRDMPIENPDLAEILKGFNKSTHLLNETINDLVKVIIIKDSPSMQIEDVDINEVFENVFNQLGFMISMHKPIMRINLNSAPHLRINKSYLESILLNLLTNAMKYRSQDRKLRINFTSKLKDKHVILTFKDNGIGIDMERHSDKVFGLYQRFHNHADSKGLGLYLVKSQVESMGGTITVESEVNKGTTFTLVFKQEI